MKQQTHDKIIDAAMLLFSKHGFAAVTTKEIAEKSGISEVTLYRHFESKRYLFTTIINERMLDTGVIEYINDEAKYDVHADLTKIANLFFEAYKQNKSIHRMIFKDKFQKSKARTQSRKSEDKDIEALLEYFIRLEEKGIIHDDPQKLHKLFLSNIHGFVIHNIILRNPDELQIKKEKEYYDWLIEKIVKIILI